MIWRYREMEKMKPSKIFQGQKYFVVEDLVKILNLTPLTVREYLKKGRIKAVKVGMRYYIAEKNLIAFLGGGRFFDQPDDIIMDKINESIKLTFESNVPWLANKVKELIAKDLTEIMSERFKKIDQGNVRSTEFEPEEKTAERIRKTEKAKKDFQEAKQM
ncbi:hypothetical protein ES703_61069 [subsurface metagenome]